SASRSCRPRSRQRNIRGSHILSPSAAALGAVAVRPRGVHMRFGSRHVGFVSAAAAVVLSLTMLSPAGAAASAATYGVQLDATPPTGEPWSFLRMFPANGVEVHQGDVVESTSASTEAPHTATFVPSDDPNTWR